MFKDAYTLARCQGKCREEKAYINIFHNHKMSLLLCSALNIIVLLPSRGKKERKTMRNIYVNNGDGEVGETGG